VDSPQKPPPIERAIEARSAEVYAGFLLPYLRPGMAVLDCGCGKATITMGLAEVVHDGRVVAVDLDQDSFAATRCYAASIGRNNLTFIVADGRRLPFHDAVFDAVLCHSVLETLDDPARTVAVLRCVTKPGGVVGAASVEYSGIIIGGEKTAGPRRFYDIRQQLWRAERIAEPNMGRRLRELFAEAGFARVEAFAGYINYGTPELVSDLARDRAAECRDPELHAAVTRREIAPVEELNDLATAWEEWAEDPGDFFAFPWCRVPAWR
jgi:ubiquinone/menaquinone biosynthesis C-methylase UbiE